ncbi:hypothetical protein [Thetidibacter halocola]|uniref:Uncharacterized protein n=1 Tax=Thetidibacter halocola TaxID=2827239 RepID=A0A8J8B5W0_9RHOB|nr:hypothetical protein [Thetidibacter halocola]MBS0122717.1 hypothetical protein [Thetidibacter halocola]
MGEHMYGVVLWADKSDNKAVIWCEDHGNLAYYYDPECSLHDGGAIDAGDLIQFDLREESECRRARNLRRVSSGFAPELPTRLKVDQPRHAPQPESTVIPFRRP